MKKLHFGLVVISFVLFISGCGSGRRDESDSPPVPMPVKYTVTEKCAFLNEKNITLRIDSLSNVLYFNIRFKGLKDLPYPVLKKYRDTLSKTAFTFELLHNGEVFRTDYSLLKNTMRWVDDTTANAMDLRIISDTIDLKKENEITFAIPMYAFHDLKKGMQRFELTFFQDLFVDEVRIKRSDETDELHVSERKPLLKGKLSFEINLPPIYKTEFCGLGLKLRNDSVYSPAGMDHTIFQSSYPDIYWCIFYPVTSPYCQTPYEKSTDEYVGHDTFNIYHYYPDDSIAIGVYDHDNLSRDDGLGSWQGTLEELCKAKYTKVLRFDAIDHFDLQVKKVGVVN